MFLNIFEPNPTTVQINAMVQWQLFRRPDGRFFGVCPALNLNAAGDDWEEFQACANEAIDLLFRSLARHNELDAFLQRNRWTLNQAVPAKLKRVRFVIPYEIQRRERFEDLQLVTA